MHTVSAIAGLPWAVFLAGIAVSVVSWRVAESERSAQVVLVTGIVISLLLFILARALVVTRERNQQSLLESKNLLNLALVGSRLALFDWDIATGKVYLSEEWARIIGAPAGPALTTFDELSDLVHPDDRAGLGARIADALKGVTEFYRAEHRVRTCGGQWKWIQSQGKVVQRGRSGRALKLTGTNADIDERKALENDLEQRNELLNAVLENIEAGIVVCDAEGTLTLFNRATREFHNLPQEPLPAARWAEHYDLYHPDGRPMHTADIPLFKALQDQPVRNEELIIAPRQGGIKRVLLVSGQALYRHDGAKLGAVVAMHDITERRQKEEAIRVALGEKETLLKEVYHRVKNNLQVIVSLLNLQAHTLADGQARAVLMESANRVRAMALVHEKLYQSRSLSSIALKEYIAELCERLAAASGARERGIALTCDVAPIEVALETAIPLGLLLNELITNSLRHGFPDGRTGEVRVSLKQAGSGAGALEVRDNGVGLKPGLDLAASPTLGLKLVATLSAQLGSKLVIKSDAGLSASLIFTLAAKMMVKED